MYDCDLIITQQKLSKNLINQLPKETIKMKIFFCGLKRTTKTIPDKKSTRNRDFVSKLEQVEF